MNKLVSVATIVAIPAMAATSLRDPISRFGAFQVLPDAPFPSQAAGLSWASEGHAQILAGTGGMYGMSVTAPHLRVSYATSDLELFDAQTKSRTTDLRRSEFDLGTGIAMSQMGIGGKSFDVAVGADLVRVKSRDIMWGLPGRKASWFEPSVQARFGSNRISASFERLLELERDSAFPLDAVTKIGFGAVRADGLQWGVGVSVPMNDDREFGLQVGAEKNFSQALSFRLQGSTLYHKAPSTVAADSGKRLWIQSGLGMAVGTTLRFRPWLADRDPIWLKGLVDPGRGDGWARYLYDWEIGALVQLDALASKSSATVTIGRWF
jgi:hypothetical protein